jgi:hypothetical protein
VVRRRVVDLQVQAISFDASDFTAVDLR